MSNQQKNTLAIKDIAVIEAATLCGELYHHMLHGGLLEKVKEHDDGVGGDSLNGACLYVAAAAANALDAFVDWDNTGGVFAYEHIECGPHGVQGLTGWLLERMTLEHWVQAAQGGRAPAETKKWVLEYLYHVLEHEDTFPLKAKPELATPEAPIRVVLDASGGAWHAVYADRPVELLIISHDRGDIADGDGRMLQCEEGEDVASWGPFEPDAADVGVVEHYFGQAWEKQA